MRYLGAISDPTIGVAALSDAGRSGKNNEDDYVAFEARTSNEEGGPGEVAVQVLVVADGIGGNVAGEMASHLAAQTFYDTFTSNSRQRVRQRLIESIDAANHAIYQKTLDQPELQGMGTTVVAAALVRDKLYVAHAGDSRAYLIRNGKAYQLTLDHTWAQEAIEAGRLTPAQAREHPNRHVIKRYLGIAPTVDIDSSLVDINRGPLDPEQSQAWPKSDQLQLQPSDTLLLCSDGLTDVVNDKQIEQTVARYQPQDAARKLVDMANSAGGPDNITVLILQRQPSGASAAHRSNRSPILAAVLGALLLVIAVAAWVLLGNRADNVAAISVAPTATMTEMTSEVVAAVPTTDEATATTEPTATSVPMTATEAPLATPSPTLATETILSPTTSLPDVPVTVDAMAQNAATNTINTLEGKATEAQATLTATPIVKPPTSTPVSDPPTMTPTATPTITPTPNPTRSATRAATATLTIPAAGSNTRSNLPTTVKLLSPSEGDTLDSKLEFSWNANSPLPDGYQFEPIFWREGEDPLQDGRGYGGTTTGTSVSVTIEVFRQSGEGKYYWGIRLVKIPYESVGYLNGKRLINVKFSSDKSKCNSDKQTC